MDARNIVEVVDTLTGPIEPYGDSDIDETRYDNLMKLESVLDSELVRIQWLLSYEKSYQFSMKRSGMEARVYLENLKKDIERWLDE